MKKLAFITNDGNTISQHFGRAPYYRILTIEEQQITNSEIREKMGHHNFASQHDHDHQHEPGQPHGFDPASRDKHFLMAEVIKDCDILFCGGMGLGARKHMEENGIQVIMTEIGNIEEALNQWINGTIIDRSERAH